MNHDEKNQSTSYVQETLAEAKWQKVGQKNI